MRSGRKRTVGLAVCALALSVATSAVAARPALAYHINYGTNGSGGAVPVGTTHTMSSGSLSLTNSAGGNLVTCPSSSLSGATTGSGGVSSGLNVSGGTFNSCRAVATGQPLMIAITSAAPWQITPTGGVSSPFTLTVSGFRVTVTCGSNSETLSGTLSTGVTWNNVAGGSNITFSHAGPLSEMQGGSGCGIPAPLYLNDVYTFATVNGSPGNFWLLS